MNLIIDGVSFDVKAEVQRTGEIVSSDISGQLLDGSYFNDVIGTYYTYDVTLKYPLYSRGKYANLYEMFTQPVDGHQFTLPYNTGVIQLTARVERVSDKWVEPDGADAYWEAFRASIIANGPTKQQTQAQAIARGLTPLPDVASPAIGDTYTYTTNGWEETSALPDADTTAY